MKAKDISGQAPGGQRTKLPDVLPLDTPFVVQIFPIYACNFKCNYCIFSIDSSKRGFISEKKIMDIGLYKKCIDELAQFPNKIKVLRFVGIGEPLLHKKIVEMVEYASKKSVSHIIEILTNGSLLSQEISDALIGAGLNRLVISLQGTSADKYQKISKINLDFEKFINNITYFYNNKKETQVYIKVVDCALDNFDNEKKFFKLFGDICDTIAIEHAVPIHAGVDYTNILKIQDNECTQFGLPVSDVNICPQPFFTMQINPDGKVVPCYSFEYPGIMGDCNSETLIDIWNGEIFRKFRRVMLDGTENVSNICGECNIIKYRLFPEDRLNYADERLKKYYDC